MKKEKRWSERRAVLRWWGGFVALVLLTAASNIHEILRRL